MHSHDLEFEFQITDTSTESAPVSVPGYYDLVESIRESFAQAVEENDGVLFTTDADGLYEVFLKTIPEEYRQYHNCSACREFVNTYGGLVGITDTGKTVPVMWNKAPDSLKPVVDILNRNIKQSTVTGIFRTSRKVLGVQDHNGWRHMYVRLPVQMRYRKRLDTVEAAMAKDREHYRMVKAAAAKYSIETVLTAINILEAGAVSGSERFIAPAKWFLSVLEDCGRCGTEKQHNLLWKNIALSPEAFFHISSGVLGTLLDDISQGYRLEQIKARFNEKMNPTQYQRPQARPSVGNVNRAEEILEKLNIQNSLLRRFAKLEELKTEWVPRESKHQRRREDGFFADIVTKESQNTPKITGIIPEKTMTWEKFQRTVLPEARKIEFYVPKEKASYSAIVTAQDLSAPPIIKWDQEEQRCPFSWYVYTKGSAAWEWNLNVGYVDVTAVVLQPNLWNPGYEHHGKSVFFILKDCVDKNKNVSSALFPSVLKSELHEIRATIEAYSQSHSLGGAEEASACGIRLQGDHDWNNVKFRVTTRTGMVVYNLDRWD